MEGSTVVIKVKHGDVLRRFHAPIVDDKLLLNMDGLREKILSLFTFAPDTDLMLTYVDEDGDMVAFVDDDDLLDVVKQGLNPLRVTVKVHDKSCNQNYSKFSGTLESIRAASDAVPFKSNCQNDSSTPIHHGIRCDGCGIHPIVGPRFKSEVKVDYDLCLDCHRKLKEAGKGDDCVRIDSPAVPRHHLPYLRVEEHGAAKLDSRFIQDVTIFDGTIMAPLTPFSKIWRMRNVGTVAWPHKTQLVWIGGDELTNTHSVEVQIPAGGLPMGQEIDVAVDFVSPELPGRYVSIWRMASPSGPKFGQRVWVLIQVEACNNKTSHDKNLNLNLPPASNLDPEPEVEAGNLKKVVETKVPNTEEELKFPINDSLLVGNGSSSPPPPPQEAAFVLPLRQRSGFPPPLQGLPAPIGTRLSRIRPASPTEPVAGTDGSSSPPPPPQEVAFVLPQRQRSSFPPPLQGLPRPISRIRPAPPTEPVAGLPVEDKLFKFRAAGDSFRAICELKYGFSR